MPSDNLQPRKAGVTVSIHPTDVPGKTSIELIDIGPVPMTLAETANVLKVALALTELGLQSGYAGERQQ